MEASLSDPRVVPEGCGQQGRLLLYPRSPTTYTAGPMVYVHAVWPALASGLLFLSYSVVCHCRSGPARTVVVVVGFVMQLAVQPKPPSSRWKMGCACCCLAMVGVWFNRAVAGVLSGTCASVLRTEMLAAATIAFGVWQQHRWGS